MTDGHLTDDQLSSHLDGVSDTDLDERVAPSVDDHLAGCARCRERSATLGVVREVIKTPVPPLATEVRAASIAAVLGTAGVPGAGATGTHDAPLSLPRRRPHLLVGVAAAIVVLGTAVGVPLALSGRTTSAGSEASRSLGRPPQQGRHGSASAAGTDTLPDHFDALVANLGTVDSLDALRSKIEALTPSAATAAPTPQNSASSPANAKASTATTTTAGSAGSAPTGVDGQGTTGQFERCLPSAMHAAGAMTSVQSLATATFRGTPALVYVLGPGSGPSQTGGTGQSVVVVTARVSCRVLGTTHL
jgi:hypothetical protein